LTGSEFMIVQPMLSASGASEYEIVSNPDSLPERPQARPNHPIEDNSSTIRPSTPSTIVGNGPSHALTLENFSLKKIDEVAGGSIQRYQQLLIADLKRKRGLAFTATSAIPAPGELIGDKQPGYATMSLGAKFWSWWTKKELQIFETQVLGEIVEKLDEQKADAQPVGVVGKTSPKK
jgi:hypothetical protein